MQFSRSKNSPNILANAVKIALLGAAVSSPAAFAQNTDESIERISIYNKHNTLILESGTATKSNVALMQTPAAIVVVDKELLKAQSATTLQEALRNVSGLGQAGNNYGIGDNLTVRGLGVNYTYDGMYGGADLGNNFNPTRSMTNVESIEVLKGPATGLYGIGAAGGVINLVEKKPQQQEAFEISAKAGSWNSYGIGFDATGGLNDQWAYRLVTNHERSDGYRDLQSDRDEVYASLSFEVNASHKLLLSTAYIDDALQIDSIGDPVRIMNWDSTSGTPGKLSGADLPNDAKLDDDGTNYLGVQLTEQQREQLAASVRASDGLQPYNLGDGNLISPLSKPNEGEELRIKLRHDWHINNDSTLTQQVLWRSYDSEFARQTGAYNYVYWERRGVINADPRAPLIIDGELHPFAARRQEYRRQVAEEQTWQYFADLQLGWSLGGVMGEHLVSVNYENREMALKSWSAYDADSAKGDNAIPYILDIRNPNWASGDIMDYDPSLRSNYDKSLDAYGISFQEVLYLTDQLTARAGLAYSAIEQAYQHKGSDRAPEASKELDSDDSGMTYNVGINYQVHPQLSAFVNVAKGRTAYSILGALSDDTASPNRPDSESESLDLGIRFTALDEDLLGSIVWFETSRTNLRYTNPLYNDDPKDPEYNISVAQYFYDDEDESKGVEIDLNLALAESVDLNLNATWQDAIEIRAQERSEQKKGVPEKMASAWVNYQLPATVLENLTLSLGVNYVDERTVNSASFGLPTATIDSYTRWDAAARYQGDQYQIQLNIENLTDERYYSKALFLGGLPGNERNVKLSVNYQF
ncbi:TonB-dependent receptor [Pseudoalteromonas sp. OOF1S-7]|uniref:TonB-dependent receptor n=1 Tax=Pseudoalteromonas sp. OOF1S-7 TaxID=2917757 RepID=UPI001EF4ABDE|nr:TonB-dependent receptor [Pseudoalteromonas sp. OOF1S-7]MCG7534293.1 TonB-dependent receptor [Pseudoalteromonas sp. OOF1S-7]